MDAFKSHYIVIHIKSNPDTQPLSVMYEQQSSAQAVIPDVGFTGV